MAYVHPAPVPDDAHAAVRQLVSTLTALPELGMRVLWLHERFLGKTDTHSALLLDQLIRCSQLADDQAREAMLALALLLAKRRNSSWLWALHQVAKQEQLPHLERVLRPAPTLPTSVSPSEPPVPDFGQGRTLSVGERKSLARRPTRSQLERLLSDPHPLVITQLLQAKGLTEEDLIVMVTRRPAHGPTLEAVLDASRWILRKRVRLCLILNPGTPHGMALPFVATCPREDLRLIFQTTTIGAGLRAVAHELYVRLPPLQSDVKLQGIH